MISDNARTTKVSPSTILVQNPYFLMFWPDLWQHAILLQIKSSFLYQCTLTNNNAEFFYNFYGFLVIHANFRLRDNNGCIVRQQWKSNDVLWLSISIPLPYHDSHWWQGIKWCSIVKFCIAIQQIKFKVNWSCAVCNFCNIISKMWNNMRKQMKFSQSQPQYQSRSGSYAGGVQADIPDICHKYHKWGMWRNFKFICMTDVEKSEISPHVE